MKKIVEENVSSRMPRRGFEKVRTGCGTCKARRVKCDETRPVCSRCQATGRKCDGYKDPPRFSFSWKELLRTRPSSTPGIRVGSAELRSLDFFRQVVAPNLSGPVRSSFWTHLVNQMAVAEPTVRHAVVAISSLVEVLDDRLCCGPGIPASHRFAICHYNRAIRDIVTSSDAQLGIAPLVSVLFICIEFLRGNSEAAINHCRHGILILNSRGSGPDLAPIFRRLSIFPFFFGGTLSNFPRLSSPACPAGWSFETNAQAQESLDWLMSRTTRLVRAADPYRLGMMSVAESLSSVAREQQQLGRQLDAWSRAFSRGRDKLSLSKETETIHHLLEMQWLVCKIWADICLDRGETACDGHVGNFERIINIAKQEAASRATSAVTPAKFIFNMGFSPLLHFVVIKCRQLYPRLAGLMLMKTLSYPRESLWDATLMYAIGTRIIEIEHGIELAHGHIDLLLKEANRFDFPVAPNQRIRDSVLEEDIRVHTDNQGVVTTRRSICFFVARSDGCGVRPLHDWVCLQ